VKSLVCLLAAGCAFADPLQFRQSGFKPGADGWTAWSDRAETAPRTFVEPVISIGEPGSLGLSGNGNLGSYGGWTKTIQGIRAGSWYRFTASYRSTGLTAENWQVLPSLDWRTARGGRAGSYEHVDYASKVSRRGEWTSVVLETEAPPAAASVVVQLFLAHAPSAMVWWDEVGFEEIPAPGRRPVTIASINLRPQKTASPEESVTQFVEAAERLVKDGADIILFPEAITLIGTGKSGDEVAERLPGPTTARLAELARKKKAYVAAGLYERDGAVVYNTAVLIDRSGNLIGRYRKVHLPFARWRRSHRATSIRSSAPTSAPSDS
jgi:hypothetical protein